MAGFVKPRSLHSSRFPGYAVTMLLVPHPRAGALRADFKIFSLITRHSSRLIQNMSHDTPVSAPKFPVPPGACDTHMHIYEPGYALREGAPHSGQPGTLKHYLEIKKKLGLTRTVIVQPSGYGTDNTCTVDAIAKL